jgi:3-isopropylmalate dehydrogenase
MAANTQTLLLLPGDGIGPEVIAETRRIAEAVAPDLKLEEAPFGGTSYDSHGEPLIASVLKRAREVDAILMGAVGGPKWDSVPRSKRPEAALLSMRKELDVYANIRPAYCFPALASSSALKQHLVEGLDLVIVRELTSGVYFGQPKEITGTGANRRAVDTQSYTSSEIRRVARVAFELARGRKRDCRFAGVLSCEKSNVMETGVLWREEVTALHKQSYSDVKLDHMLADAAAMHLVKAPKDINVLLADNLFGDILSDEAAMLTGSIGMLPSAALGDPGTPGLYEPVHGSRQSVRRYPLLRDGAALVARAH